MNVIKIGDTGTDVKLIQSLLKKIGYNVGKIDGIFGEIMFYVVKAFQFRNGLVVDGIIGKATLEKLEPLIDGYDVYTIRARDSLYKIATKYYTNLQKILAANPGIDPFDLNIGQKIIVPYGIDVVFTDIDYTYRIMERNINGLKKRYPFLEVGTAGKSVLNRELYYIRLGRGPNQVFYNASHHAIEWITTPLLMKFVEKFSEAFSRGERIRGYNTVNIWDKSSIYIIPMVNPDGVDLVLEGLKKGNPFYDNLLEWNKTGLPFSNVWSANIRGVDLNHNYPAGWEKYKQLEPSLGILGPGPTRFSGTYPLSEPETRSIVEFAKNHNFRLAVAYHTQGQIIYWTYNSLQPHVSRTIGEMFSKASGYSLDEPEEIASYSGFKDWFIQEYTRPGFTIEAGKGKNPIQISQFDKIYNEIEEVLLLASIV